MTLDLLKQPPDWSSPNWADRISMCASMLFCHGYIPMGLNDKIHRKLEVQFAQAIEARRDGRAQDCIQEGGQT